ncbi:N-terminal phage integrase SAM-like domain-containing protein [Streptomyces sp. M19]
MPRPPDAPQRKRNPNGAGTITKRKDGRYQCAVYVLQPDGTRARKFAYGKTWAECDAKRRELLDKAESGVPVPTRSAKLSEWLTYWLENVIKPRRKRTTFAKYEVHVRLYLVPMLGTKRLESLSVSDVRRFLARLERQASAATAKESHKVLRTALTAACREELITRNVVSLVEPPASRRATSRRGPWTRRSTFSRQRARTRCTRRSCSPSRSASGGVRSSVSGGRTSTWTGE